PTMAAEEAPVEPMPDVVADDDRQNELDPDCAVAAVLLPRRARFHATKSNPPLAGLPLISKSSFPRLRSGVRAISFKLDPSLALGRASYDVGQGPLCASSGRGSRLNEERLGMRAWIIAAVSAAVLLSSARGQAADPPPPPLPPPPPPPPNVAP